LDKIEDESIKEFIKKFLFKNPDDRISIKEIEFDEYNITSFK